jgi:hypothetical protein
MEMGRDGHGSCKNDEILRVSSSMNIADSPRRDGHPIFFSGIPIFPGNPHDCGMTIAPEFHVLPMAHVSSDKNP